MPTILITGASRGLGFEFTRQYAHEGADVIACCRAPDKAEKLKAIAQQHKNIRIEALDVADQKSIAALAIKLKDTAIDVLINNAGIFSGTGRKGSDFQNNNDDKTQTFGSIDAESWDRVLRTNIIAPIMMTQAFVPHITQGKERKIIMITSKMGSIELTGEGDIAYRTSKAALNAAMRNVAITLKPEKIAIACLHPGWVKTDMGGAYANLTPDVSVEGLRKTIAGLTLEKTGSFFNYDGTVIAW